MVSHQDYYRKIASVIADVPPQIVIVSTSHSFARVITTLLRSVKTPREKKKLKYPRNLSLKEIKSCYRDKLPVGLVISHCRMVFSAFVFATTSISSLASVKWYQSKSIFIPQLKYIISIDSLLLYSPFTRVLRKLRYTDHFLTVVSLSQLQKYRPTIMGSSSV